jgi:predicted YcjX-like family ATPase
VTASLRLPENSTDFVVTRDSLIAIVENLRITSGIIRVKASDGAWQEVDIQNIEAMVVPISNNSSTLEIEVLEEGSTFPVSYSVSISTDDGLAIWPTQVLIFLAGIATLWFMIIFVRRRRESESA